MKFFNFKNALALFLLIISSYASAWWNDEWPYRTSLNIDASATGANLSETNENVTVLVKLHTGNFEDFFLVKENLADLRFIADDDKTPLKHHVEHFDLINQFIYVWVKLPKISAGINTEKFWMYYGNEQAVSNEDPAGTFDNNTALAYHFKANENPPGDVTAYGAHAANFTGTLVNNSLIASGANFNGTNQLVINDLPSLALLPGKGLTVSLWMKPMGAQQNAVIFERASGSTSLKVSLSDNNISAQWLTSSGKQYQTPAVPAITPDTWQHIALVIEEGKMTLFVNANPIGFAGVAIEPMVGNWTFGSSVNNADYFSGEIDELKISTVARNASWIKTSVATQGLASSLIKPQSAEQLGGGGGGNGLWQVMFTSTEESGWTVIALLGVMALLSWVVMIGKFLYMQRVSKDDKGFLKEYDKIKFKNPALLDHGDNSEEKEFTDSPILQAIFGKHDHYQSSPIYRLYHRGIQEVQQRLGQAAQQGKNGLNKEAVDAIKAAVDSQIIREIQRLNSKMVMLTIAISGGPFLGLLGTVLGVMITFAAIALTGDVNISAIAPGVAAALLTTVAGLVVAIPALFGYNYLTIRIKESIANMRVFADEYVTRLGEYYKDYSVLGKVNNIKDKQAN